MFEFPPDSGQKPPSPSLMLATSNEVDLNTGSCRNEATGKRQPPETPRSCQVLNPFHREAEVTS